MTSPRSLAQTDPDHKTEAIPFSAKNHVCYSETVFASSVACCIVMVVGRQCCLPRSGPWRANIMSKAKKAVKATPASEAKKGQKSKPEGVVLPTAAGFIATLHANKTPAVMRLEGLVEATYTSHQGYPQGEDSVRLMSIQAAHTEQQRTYHAELATVLNGQDMACSALVAALEGVAVSPRRTLRRAVRAGMVVWCKAAK